MGCLIKYERLDKRRQHRIQSSTQLFDKLFPFQRQVLKIGGRYL